MKKILQKNIALKAMLLVSFLVGAVSGTWATDVKDVLNRDLTGITSTTYSVWTKKQATSDAVYAGQTAGGNNSIQLRSNNNNSGVVTTTSGGKLKSITVKFNSSTAAARVLDIYAKSTAYSDATDLYSSKAGTKVTSFTMSKEAEQTYTFTDSYTFVGFRSSNGALYLDEVTIVWDDGKVAKIDPQLAFAAESASAVLGESFTPPTLSNAEGVSLAWSSSNEAVATVDENGTVTPVATGTTTITASHAEDDSYTASLASYELTVYPAGEKIKVDIATITAISPVALTTGDKGQFALTATFAEGTTEDEDYEVSWTTSDASVLALSGTAYTAVKAGTATVTVHVTVLDDETYNEVEERFVVTVKDPSTPFVKVTSADQLIDGAEYLLVTDVQNGHHALGAISGSIYKGVDGFTVTNSQIEEVPEGAAVLTLEQVGGTNWAFKSSLSNKYLALTASSNSLNAADDASDKSAQWTIAFANSGMTINSVNISGRSIKWNSNSPRFACYTSGQTAVVLYRKDTPVVLPVATIGELTPTSLKVGDTDEFQLTITPQGALTAEDYTVVWSSSNAEGLELVDNMYAAEAAGTYTVTVTVTPKDTDNYKTVSKTFAVTVDKADIATIGELAPTVMNVDDLDEFTLPITPAEGATAADYTVQWQSSDASLLEVDGNAYAALAEGDVKVTVTVAPVNAAKYNTVSKTFDVSIIASNKVYAPTISPEEGEFLGLHEVTIATVTPDATIYYTLDGSTPTAESAVYTAPFEVEGDITVKAVAIKDEVSSEVATATYTGIEYQNGIAALKAVDNTSAVSVIVKLTDAVVTAVNSGNVYVEDADAGVCLYMNNPTLHAGDKLNGYLSGTYTVYNGLNEVTNYDLTGLTIEAGAEIPYTELTVAQLNADVDAYESMRILVREVTASQVSGRNATATDAEGNSIAQYASLSSATVTNGQFYDLYCYPSNYRGTTPQLNVVAIADIHTYTVGTASLNPATGELLVGERLTLVLTTNNEAGTQTWTSSDEEIATVENGIVTAVAEGETTITVTVAAAGSYTAATATATITVVGVKKTEATIAFGETPATIDLGETATYAATTNSNATIAYSSSAEDVVSVNAEGQITALAAGTATIYAAVEANDEYTAAETSYQITVVNPNVDEFDLGATAGYANAEEVGTIEGNKGTLTTSKGSSNNAPKYYTTGAATRFYQNNTLTIASDTKEIASIELIGTQTLTKFTTDNSNYTSAGSDTDITFAAAIGYRSKSVTLTLGGNAQARITKVVVTYAAPSAYTRDVTAGNYGTICLAQSVERVADVEVYSIAGRVDDAEGNPAYIVLQQEEGALAAGQPYLFKAAGEEGTTTVRFLYGAETAATAGSHNGLVGSLERTAVESGNYVLSNNQIVKAGENVYIGANRAYIDMTEVPAISEEAATGLVKIGLVGTGTGIRAIDAAAAQGKVHDLAGRRVATPTKGLYIVNGKKVAVK